MIVVCDPGYSPAPHCSDTENHPCTDISGWYWYPNTDCNHSQHRNQHGSSIQHCRDRDPDLPSCWEPAVHYQYPACWRQQ
ncbi:hypothetical protein DPMN_147775 [Dreissena polymorpha]|uniref:Uncharacterized protein n=1 Tax=Dreissena polymorpha TaxID=45954 RepID=A0A9D4F8C2_DREPO|nr:hypothetical protein DPMN_147775 [Dreissena polymorpha]